MCACYSHCIQYTSSIRIESRIHTIIVNNDNPQAGVPMLRARHDLDREHEFS